MDELISSCGGVITRDRALRTVTRAALDNALRRGRLRRLFPSVYADAERAQEPAVLRRAALAYAGPDAALSHLTALARWGLADREPEVVHLCVPAGRRLRATRGVVAHRRAGFAAGAHAVVRGGLPLTRLETTVVDSWPSLLPARRDPVIRAVSERMTTPDRLRRAVVAAPNLRGRAELLALIHLLDSGCRSELEIWGHEHVFRGPGMPRFQRQFPVAVGARTFYLDVYAEAERVDFELDGAASHGAPDQRERDLRRDAALATCGIAVVRFSHRRLTTDPDAVRREVLSVLAARRSGS